MLRLVMKSEEAFQEMVRELRAEGFYRTANCYWYEVYSKDGEIVELERDF